MALSLIAGCISIGFNNQGLVNQSWEFTDRLLDACGIESDTFTAGSDAKLIGTVQQTPVVDENGRPTGEVNHITVPGLLNGTRRFYSMRLLYCSMIQRHTFPIRSFTFNKRWHLWVHEPMYWLSTLRGRMRTPSGVSL